MLRTELYDISLAIEKYAKSFVDEIKSFHLIFSGASRKSFHMANPQNNNRIALLYVRIISRIFLGQQKCVARLKRIPATRSLCSLPEIVAPEGCLSSEAPKHQSSEANWATLNGCPKFSHLWAGKTRNSLIACYGFVWTLIYGCNWVT